MAKKLGWIVVDDKYDGKWDLCWTDYTVRPETLIRMHFHQAINYIPGISVIARKNLLGTNLNIMKQFFPNEYNFYP